MADSDGRLSFKCSCFCGKAKFEVRQSKPIFRCRCHCSICQRMSGGDSVAFAGFPVEDVHFLEGEHVKFATSKSMDRYRCAECGAPTYNRSLMEDYKFIDFSLATLERNAETNQVDMAIRKALEPTAHIHYEMRLADAADELKKFRGMYEAPVDNAGKDLPQKKD